MRLFACLLFHSSIGRRCISAILLLAYMVTAVGVPISLGTAPLGASEPYPCMAGACGCQTAKQCWQSCCCHSLAERLAWARARGVQPPPFALAQARAMGLDPATFAKSCSLSDARSCCTSHEQEAISTPVSGSITGTGRGVEATERDDHVVAWRVLACRGQTLQWIAAVPTLIVVRPDLSPEILLIDWLASVPSAVTGRVSDSPVVPPPEQA